MDDERRALTRLVKLHLDGLNAFGVTAVPVVDSVRERRRPSHGVKGPDDRALEPPMGRDPEGSRLERLEQLAREITRCRRCPLYRTRTHVVISDGTPRARLVFVGEAPGREEDLQGKPFVGAAGQLLTKMIEAIGMTREDVYICNVLKDRPPANRTPLPEEMEACLPFLQEQLSIIQPKVVCTLGAVATKALLGPHVSITKIRGSVHDYQGLLLVPTFHPAYLLRNPPAKQFAWVDLKTVKRLLEQRSVSDQ